MKEIPKIRLVEIEVHSFCNRKCSWCPNSFIDRKSKTEYLDESVYLQLLEDLSLVEYSGRISFSRYNEPFADNVIYKRLKQARETLPKALLHTNSNGDYLTREALERAGESGLHNIAIQIYLRWPYQTVLNRANELMNQIGVELQLLDNGVFEAKIKTLTVSVYHRDFSKDGVNRCGLLVSPEIERQKPCMIPQTDIYVDYNGSVIPCCNVRSDYEPHKELILGNLHENRIFEIWQSEKARKWRELVSSKGEKPYPCNTCSFGVK